MRHRDGSVGELRGGERRREPYCATLCENNVTALCENNVTATTLTKTLASGQKYARRFGSARNRVREGDDNHDDPRSRLRETLQRSPDDAEGQVGTWPRPFRLHTSARCDPGDTRRSRDLVAQICPRWNRVADWLREAELFSTAA